MSLVSFLAQYIGETASAILCTLLCILIPYLLGSVNFALVISKVFYHDDIRKYGSGNAGMTNMLRTYGTAAGAATLLCDMLKSVLSVLFGNWVFTVQTEDGGVLLFGGCIAGLACVVGHIFPIFFGFKGGKGVATVAAMILTINPLCFAILAVIFVLLVAATRYISLGSVICMMLYPIVLDRLGMQGFPVLTAVLLAVLVVYMHRENIKRLRNHTENKISFKKKNKEQK